MQKYSATIQYTDMTAEPGYRECLQDVTVSADSTDAAFEAARNSRELVSRVQLNGVVGGPGFEGRSWVRHYQISA
jgi:hypothetical protein